MKNFPRRSIPPALAEQYDDYVADAVALANRTLSPEREAEVRGRMANDPTYRAVLEPILAAKANPVQMSASEMDARWEDFRRRAELATPSDDLAAFQGRVRARDRATQRRMMLFAALLSFLVVVPVVGLTWMYATYFEQVETAANVTSEVRLPDGSVATLAPSSKLEYRTGMVTPLGDLDRDVELSGTADFVVTQRAPSRFTVITDHAHMIVMSTRFRVEHHAPFTLVRVQEGTVSVQPLNGDGDFVGQPLTLEAGGGARIFSGGAVELEGSARSPNPGKQP